MLKPSIHGEGTEVSSQELLDKSRSSAVPIVISGNWRKFRPESYLKESQEFRFNSCYRKLAGVSPQEVPDEIAGVSSLDLLVKTGRSFVARGT